MLIDTSKFKCRAGVCQIAEEEDHEHKITIIGDDSRGEVYCERCGGRIFEEENFSDEVEIADIPTEEQEKEMLRLLDVSVQAKTTVHFFREPNAEDPDDFNVLDMRIAALAEELGKDAQNISLKQLDEISKAVKNEN